MTICNVILSTEPEGGKGGVATVVPMYMSALKKIGDVEFVQTHHGNGALGKIVPWMLAFIRVVRVIFKNWNSRIVFHLHPGSGFCLIRMLVLAIYLKYLLRQSVVIYFHTPYLEVYLKKHWWSMILRSLVRCSRRVVVLTSYAFKLLERNGISSNAYVMPNPFEMKNDSRRAPVKKEREVEILTMGRLVEGKGVLETVRALNFLPANYRLVIAGDGILASELRSEIAALGLNKRVEMKGWVVAEEKEKLLASADVFCLPSRVDSFGMSFVEAQAYDLPIVAFNHPPVIEVLQPTTSVVVSDLDPRSIAIAIDGANKIGCSIEPGSGQKWVIDTFGIERISNELACLVGEIIPTVA